MQTFDMQKTVVLTNKREITLNDQLDIFLSLIDDTQEPYIFPVPYPLGGYGGGGLFLSPSENYLLFSYYSGQSSETFMLFKIEGHSLELLYDSGDLRGENGDFCFSDDEKYLFQALRTGWWYAGEEDEAKTDKDGNKFYEFGIINILKIKERVLEKHIIYVYPSDDWEIEITDFGPFEFSKITDRLLNIAMPWGKETLNCPLKDVIIIKSK